MHRFNCIPNVNALYRTVCRFKHSWHPPSGHDTGIQVYNCVAKKNVSLILRHPRQATWYSCGPTVYDSTHIGHASCYVKQDILQRILRNHFNINLVTAMNITDIDDKIVKRSEDAKEDWLKLAHRYEQQFWSDLTRLNCEPPNIKVRVSEHIDQIIEFIQRLLSQGTAYTTNDGSVYFDVSLWPTYGKLQRLNLKESAQREICVDEERRSANDFALWKGRPIATSEPTWPVPWHSSMRGRPGWHIECSAMASQLFGDCIDFHAGGKDLRFPHHENEEAQSCSFHDCRQWVNYWIHTGQLHVQGETEKMSKSLRNTIGVDELLRTHSADQFRMLCLLSNYQNQIDFGPCSMETSVNVLKRLQGFHSDSKTFVTGQRTLSDHYDAAELYGKLNRTEIAIDEALRDNFNTSKCVEHLLELVSYSNKMMCHDTTNFRQLRSVDLGAVQAVNNFIQKIFNCFGLNDTMQVAAKTTELKFNIDSVVEEIVKIRSNIRGKALVMKDQGLLIMSDNIRNDLKRHGICIKDHGGMSTWSRD